MSTHSTELPTLLPVLALWEWQSAAACRADPEVFFHPWGERPPSRARREDAAKAICADCPVKAPCREHGLSFEEYGVWGGLSPHDREIVLGRTFSG